MKTLFTWIAICSVSILFAQTDSTTLKLQQYKSWKDAGVIDDEEYNRLKGGVLNLPPIEKKQATISKADSATLEKYRSRAVSNTAGGAVMLSVGGIFIAGAVSYAVVTPAYTQTFVDGNLTRIKNDNRPLTLGCTIGVGVTSAIVGIALLATGGKNRSLYLDERSKLSLLSNPDSIGLCFNF